jgi:outer membrane immunogenic protein
MRKSILTAALAALACPAFAADLPSLKDSVVPPPVFSWTGFYIGADIGGGWGDKTVNYPASLFAPAGSFGLNLTGVVGGGFIGYNYQINQVVLGLQGDIQGASLWGATYLQPLDSTTKATQDWLAAINGRLGYALDRALFYVIGGVAFTNETHVVSAGPFATAALAAFGILSPPQTFSFDRTGYDVGAGIEYAVLPNWTLRVEYRYYNFGSWNFPTKGWVTGGGPENLSDNTVTFGMSYLFGAPAAAPVLAKY